jgi:hypothetical protein
MYTIIIYNIIVVIYNSIRYNIHLMSNAQTINSIYFKPAPHTLKHITPQPSTPIERAGSDYS